MISVTDMTASVAGKIRVNNNTTDVTRWLILDNLNEAVRDIIRRVDSKFISEAVATRTLTFSNGVSAYQWPADFARFIRAWARYSATGRWIDCVELSKDEADTPLSLDRQPRQAAPVIHLEEERGFNVTPAPTADVLTGLKIRFLYFIPELSASQDCLLDEGRWRSLIENKAAALSAAIEGKKADLAKFFDDQYETGLGKFLPKSENSR